MSTPTIRAALERLVELNATNPLQPGWAQLWVDAIVAARAALEAEPAGEGPSEEGIAEMAEELEWRRLPRAEGTGNSLLLDLSLAVLARWGRPAAPPALPPD